MSTSETATIGGGWRDFFLAGGGLAYVGIIECTDAVKNEGKKGSAPVTKDTRGFTGGQMGHPPERVPLQGKKEKKSFHTFWKKKKGNPGDMPLSASATD